MLQDYPDLFHVPIMWTTNHTSLKISQNWPKLATMFLNIMLPMEVLRGTGMAQW